MSVANMDNLIQIGELRAQLAAAVVERDEARAQLAALLDACRIAQRRFSEQNGQVSEHVWRENYEATKALSGALEWQSTGGSVAVDAPATQEMKP